MKNNTTKRNQHKTTVPAHLEMMLLVITLAALCFAAGYYFAAEQFAAMMAN